jgi:hypothetical protein
MILANPKPFFDAIRQNVFDGNLTEGQVAGLNTLLAEVPDAWPRTWTADLLAQTTWESDHTMQPVREAYRLSDDWRRRHLRYYPYYGRGLIQLTWRSNYDFYGRLFGVDLVDDPDKALEPILSAKIAIHGMETGRFTGRKLADFLPADGSIPQSGGESAFYWCREIVNGLDKAAPIESLAQAYLQALKA